MIFFVFLLGLVVGSFLSALTYRFPLGESVLKGRSRCPDCKKLISWYQNIPLFSFFVLKGKCKNCRKKISIRYPAIEVMTATIFAANFLLYDNVLLSFPALGFLSRPLGLVYLLALSTILLAVFIVDFEKQYIPDTFSFLGIALVLILLIFTDNPDVYKFLLSGFVVSFFLLAINLGTKGRGMGLGDVKLAVFLGSLFYLVDAIIWISLSFVVGSLAGVFLIAIGQTRFGKQIAFGPFLITALYLMLYFGHFLRPLILLS